IYPNEVIYSNNEYRSLQKYLFQLNQTIPIEIWHPPNIDALWDTMPDGLYYQQILQALQEYKVDIPDPTKWSQEYPMYCSQVEMERIRLHNSLIQEDKYEDEDTCKDNYSESSMDSAQLSHFNAKN
ncbi:hypothetical protein J1N35_005660, partial [Gossypium stocksii]